MNPRESTPPRLKDPRTVLLLHPFQLPVTTCLFAVSVVFGVSPDMLEHTAISFETRGIIHHLWHWALLFAGSALTLVGLFATFRRVGIIEGAGLVLLASALFVNLLAVISDGEAINGLTLAIRSGLLIGLATRIWIVLAEPVVIVRAGRDDR